MLFMKIIAQGFRPQNRNELMLIGTCRLHEIHRAKPAWIVKSDACAVLHMKDHMIVFFGGGMFVVKHSQRIA